MCTIRSPSCIYITPWRGMLIILPIDLSLMRMAMTSMVIYLWNLRHRWRHLVSICIISTITPHSTIQTSPSPMLSFRPTTHGAQTPSITSDTSPCRTITTPKPPLTHQTRITPHPFQLHPTPPRPSPTSTTNTPTSTAVTPPLHPLCGNIAYHSRWVWGLRGGIFERCCSR